MRTIGSAAAAVSAFRRAAGPSRARLAISIAMAGLVAAWPCSAEEKAAEASFRLSFDRDSVAAGETAVLAVRWVGAGPPPCTRRMGVVSPLRLTGWVRSETLHLVRLRTADEGTYRAIVRLHPCAGAPTDTAGTQATRPVELVSPPLEVTSGWHLPDPAPAVLSFLSVVLGALVGGLWQYWKETHLKRTAAALDTRHVRFEILLAFLEELRLNQGVLDRRGTERLRRSAFQRHIERGKKLAGGLPADYGAFERYYGAVGRYNQRLSDLPTPEEIVKLHEEEIGKALVEELRTEGQALDDQLDAWIEALGVDLGKPKPRPR